MQAFLYRLIHYSTRPPRIPILVLVIAILISGFALFSSEQFFCQLDTSRSAVSTSELLAELKSLNTELRNVDAFERTLLLTGDQATSENFTHALTLLVDHVRRLNSMEVLNSISQTRLANLLTKIEAKVMLGKKIAAERVQSSLNTTNNLAKERNLDNVISGALLALIGDQTRRKDNFTATIQNARFTTQFLILTFRTAIAIFLLVCLLLAARYFTEKRAMEAKLRGAEKKFRAVLDQTFQFSGVLSPSGELLDFNRTLLGFSEIDVKEVLHQPFWELKWWQQSPQTQRDLRAAVAKAAGGDFTRLEGELVNGRERIILDLSVRPIMDEAGCVSMLILEARDITRHKLAEQASAERAARLNAIVETAPDGIVTLTTDGRIESVNNAMDVIFGYSADEMVGQHIDLVMPGFFTEADKDLPVPTLKVGERRIVGSGRETMGIRKDGLTVPVELSLSALRLGDYQILTGIVRDISERKQAQQRLKDFYSNVSHELRTPLTSIRTALTLIEEGVAGVPTPETEPIVHIAQSEADRLIRLINDLLDIRKIEEGKLTFKLTDVEPKRLVEKAINAVTNIASKSQVELVSNIQTTASLRCDEDRIIQVLTNLLSNAIKFSPPKETVAVCVEANGQACLFSISDAGCGISESQMHKLFGRFEQLQSNLDSRKTGSGLGLFISKAIVEHHGGLIGVDSSYEKGSRFWFELPTNRLTAN